MIHPFGVTGFNLLTALSTRNDSPEEASRPFDRGRDGFVIGATSTRSGLRSWIRVRAISVLPQPESPVRRAVPRYPLLAHTAA